MSQLARPSIRSPRIDHIDPTSLVNPAPARQPDRMGQRHSLRPVRPRSRPGPLRNGFLCCISTRMWALPSTHRPPTFETFPFPDGLTPDVPAASYANDPRASAIADAARRLIEFRDRWLNPPEWVEWVDEPVPGLPQAAGSPQRNCRQGPQEAHPHEPLQRPPAMARGRPRRPRRRRRKLLRLARRTSLTTMPSANC